MSVFQEVWGWEGADETSSGEAELAVHGIVSDEQARLAAAAPELVRALVLSEWADMSAGEYHVECPVCHLHCGCEVQHTTSSHDLACPVDAALTKAGLPDQVSRETLRSVLRSR